MIKAVLFDFGGVLSEAGRRGSIRRVFGEVYGLDLNVMDSILKIDDITQKMWRGHISNDAFFAEISQRYPNLPAVTIEQFRSHMDALSRSRLVYQLADELRTAGIKTGILSNVFGPGVEALRSSGFYDGFDPVLLSCEVGYAKPDKQFYQMAITQLGVKPDEIIFIDDQLVCLEPAKAMGMHVILAKTPKQIVRDTKELVAKQNGAPS